MEFYDVINNRESIRNYDKNKKINKEILERILNAGIVAPSACNLQPWEFIVVSSEEMLKKVTKCYGRDWLKNAPHILIIKGNYKNSWNRRHDEYNSLETDLTIAMDHMILAAENEGIGTCWIAAYNPELLRKTLNLKEDEEIFAITPLGYPEPGFTKRAQKQRKSFEEVVTFI